MALPEFPPNKRDWLPGAPPKEPPLPRWALHELGLNPGIWILEPKYRDDYERIASQYGTWAVKRAAVTCGEGKEGGEGDETTGIKCVEREAEALQAAHLAAY